MAGSIRDARITVWKGDMSVCYVGDASRSDCAGGRLWYEVGPGGCLAGELGLGLVYEDVEKRGYWVGPNIVEISTGDDVLQAPIGAGATKLYVKSRKPYDPALGADAQQLYITDGVHLTMGIPVTGVGTDGGGDFLTVGAPNTAIPGNPATIPAYGAGVTVGRRVYAGIIRMRTRPNQKYPQATISLGPLSSAFDEAVDGYTVSALANYDVTAAISTFVGLGAAQWPHLIYNGSNFTTNTGVVFSGQRTDATIAQMISDGLLAINTGDMFVVRVGHDRTPRWVRYYTSATNTYTYNQAFLQGSITFEPLEVQIVDQDYSSFYNRIKVNGTTNPSTQQPYSAIVTDNTSVAFVGRVVDGTPVTLSACNSDLACAQAARALLNQNSLGKLRGTFKVFTRSDVASPDFMPLGLPVGDAIRGYECVTVSGFDAVGLSTNNAPDSECLIPALWSGGNGGMTLFTRTGQNGLWYVDSGSTGFVDGPLRATVGGAKFRLSSYIDATNCTTGAPDMYAVTDLGVVAGSGATQTPGVQGRVVGAAFTIPAGATWVRVRFAAEGLTSTGHVYWGQPMLSAGVTDLPYAINTAASNVYGLVSSAKSVIDFSTLESWQEVSFNPIEPSWMAAVNERANVVMTAAHNNTGTNGAIAGYIVSGAAFPPTYSTASRVLSTPAFLAQFGVGGAIVSVPAGTITLPASTTSWIFLSSGGTWSTNGQPIPVAGSIMYGYATTSATGILGFTPLASVGVVTLSTIQNPGQPAGTTLGISGYSIASYSGAGGGTVNANIAFTAVVTPPGGDPRPFSQWGAGGIYWAKINDTGSVDADTNVAHYTAVGRFDGTTIPSADQVGPLAAGHAFQLMLQLIDQQGAPGACAIIGLTVAQNLANSTLPKATGTPTFSVSGVSTSVTDAGAGTATNDNPVIKATFTLNESNSPALSSWSAFFCPLIRVHSVASVTDATTYQPLTPKSSTGVGNGSTVTLLFPCSPGDSYDIAIQIADGQGTSYPGTTTCVSLATSVVVGKVSSSRRAGAIIGRGNFIGDTTADTSTAIIDTTGYLKFGQLIHPAIETSQNRNLLRNGNAELGDMLATGGGWSQALGVAAMSSHSKTDTFGAATIQQCLGVLPGGGITQDFPVQPNTDYSYAVAVIFTAAGQSVAAHVTNNAQTANLSTTAQPVGSPPAGGYYLTNGTLEGSNATTATSAWRILAGRFNSGARTSVTLVIYNAGSSTFGFDVAAAMAWPGTKWQDYISGDVLPGGILDSHIGSVKLGSINDDVTAQRYAVLAIDANRRPLVDFTKTGHVAGSSFANAQGSILPFVTNINLTITAAGGGVGTLTVSTNAGSFYRPDGTSVSVAANSQNFTGLFTTGHTYYIAAYAAATTGSSSTMSYNCFDGVPTIAQQQALLEDGFLLMIQPATAPTPGGGGSGGGNGKRYL